MNKHITKRNFTTMTQIAALGALAFLSVNVSPALAATLSRSVDVSGTLSAVWSMIGPFCAIKDWLPPVGTCTESGASPLERTRDQGWQGDVRGDADRAQRRRT